MMEQQYIVVCVWGWGGQLLTLSPHIRATALEGGL